MKNRPFLERLSFAVLGISAAWRRERSFRTQVMIGMAATVFTAVLAPGLIRAAAVALSIALVLALELLNTALECIVDELHPETAPEIKLAKDIAAGSVLVASVAAVIVGAQMIGAVVLR
jgi:diacylglycerol kinase (ATP)